MVGRSPSPIPLLPFERRLAEELGITEEDYQAFKAEAASRCRVDPARPTAGIGALSFALNLVVGAGFTLLASLFRPKPQKQPTVNVRQVSGGDVTEVERRSPRYGFNSVQEIARAGQRYPVVVARRRQGPDGRWYGGVRVNLLLVWSQMLSQQGSQLFKAIYLLGRRDMGLIDARQFAFGDNTLIGYDLGSANDRSARYALYYSANGGRLTTNDWIAGINPYRDVANAQNFGGSDVYSYTGYFGAVEDDFCSTSKPSISTTFGVYGLCPNGMAYRVAPRLRPTCSCTVRSGGSGTRVECEDDTAALAEFWKSKFCWSTYSGFRRLWHDGTTTYPGGTETTFVEVDVVEGDLLTYTLMHASDAKTKIRFYTGNTDADDNDSQTILDCTDVAGAVAGIQRSADSRLQVGELYKAGSAWVVLEGRVSYKGFGNYYTPEDGTNEVFVSEADNEPVSDGVSVDYQFRVVRAGTVGFVGERIFDPPSRESTIEPPQYNRNSDMADLSNGYNYKCATNFPQLTRMAVAAFGVTRPTKMIEVGFRHTLGIRIGGLTNFRSCPKLKDVNYRAGQRKSGDSVSSSYKLNTSIFQSGVVSRPEERFAFFSVWIRDGNDEPWNRFGDGIFGFCSATSEAAYEFMRIQFPHVSSNWQVMCEPLSGWQVRSNAGWGGDIIVITGDATLSSRTDSATGVRIDYIGYQIEEEDMNNRFGLWSIDAKIDIGYGFMESAGVKDSMIDSYGKLAEAFVYSEIKSSADNGPEIEISYVNVFCENEEQANYEDLSLIGINVWGNASLSDLQQASQGVNEGYFMRRLLEEDSRGPTNLFPDWLWEMMTSPWLGNAFYITDAQIDIDSFRAAAQWCYDRCYFYDAVEPAPLSWLAWGADVAATHLLQLVKRGSKFSLKPALIFDEPVPISGLFTAGNIEEGTFEIETIPFEERQQVAVIGKYREQAPSVTGFSPALFPTDRTVFIREQGRPDTDPIEEIDLAAYCTSEKHLIDAVCFYIRRKRLADHTIRFQTTTEGLTASLASGDYIQVAYDLIYFDQFAHGIITNEGKLITTRPDLATPGSHDCLTWDCSSSPAIEQTVTINSDETASPAGIVFALKQVEHELRTYEVTRIRMTRDGVITIEAIYHPCDADGYSLIAKDWTTYDTDANWEIRR